MNKQKFKAGYHFDFFYLAAFGIPIVIMAILYAVAGYYPFGDKSILVWDLEIQYVSFFSWMNRVLCRQSLDTLFYSFSLSLGGSTMGLLGYYLLSPFNLLLIPFSTKYLPIGIQLMVMLKFGFCGTSMYYFLKKRFGTTNYGTVLFAVMYALMGYTVTQQSNIMWMDGVILLPIILLNIYRLVREERCFWYPLWICLAVVTDFYIAYMIILFSMVYYWMEQGMCEHAESWKKMLKKFFYLLGLTLLGVGLSSLIFVPVLYEIFSIGRGSGGIIESLKLLFQFDSRIGMLPIKCLIGAYDRAQLINGLPNIYVSIFCVPFLGMFFLDKRNTTKGRWSNLIGIALLLFSFASKGMNQIWHGFTYTSGSNYRYSFCLAFLFIIIGYQQYLRIRNSKKIFRLSKWALAGEILIVFWMLKVAYKQFDEQIYEFSSIWKWMLTGCVFLCALGCALWIRKNGSSKICYGLFTLVMSVELVMNMYWCMQDFDYQSLREYQDYVVAVENTYHMLENENPSTFFRMEQELRDPLNDGMLIGYPSITHYSSVVRNEVAQYAIEHDILADGFGRQATLFRDYNISTEQLGRYAGKYLLTYRLPMDGNMDGWIIRQEKPFYILENTDFKPLCYLEKDKGTVNIQIRNSAHIIVNVSDITGNGDVLLTSIPDRKGWTVTVDGEKVVPSDEDLFIQIPVDEGKHQIVMRFHQPLLLSGALLSAAFAVIFILWRRKAERKWREI